MTNEHPATPASAETQHDPNFWFALIDERTAAAFAGVGVRMLQKMRQRGGGPRYVVLSARCIRYRRSELRSWADQRLRSSTSDPGQPEPAAAEVRADARG